MKARIRQVLAITALGGAIALSGCLVSMADEVALNSRSSLESKSQRNFGGWKFVYENKPKLHPSKYLARDLNLGGQMQTLLESLKDKVINYSFVFYRGSISPNLEKSLGALREIGISFHKPEATIRTIEWDSADSANIYFDGMQKFYIDAVRKGREWSRKHSRTEEDINRIRLTDLMGEKGRELRIYSYNNIIIPEENMPEINYGRFLAHENVTVMFETTSGNFPEDVYQKHISKMRKIK